MLGCIQPMSSPMMNMMLGFDVACAIALDASRADAVASAAIAVPAAKQLRLKLISSSCQIGILRCRAHCDSIMTLLRMVQNWRRQHSNASDRGTPPERSDRTLGPSRALSIVILRKNRRRPIHDNAGSGDLNSPGIGKITVGSAALQPGVGLRFPVCDFRGGAGRRRSASA